MVLMHVAGLSQDDRQRKDDLRDFDDPAILEGVLDELDITKQIALIDQMPWPDDRSLQKHQGFTVAFMTRR